MIVLGSANMDIVVRTARAPGPGETVIGHDYALHPGGKGANQAIAAQRAGARVRFAGCLGTDSYGDTLARALTVEAIDLAALHRIEAATGIALITVEANGENRIIVIAGANFEFVPDLLPAVPAASVLLAQLEIPVPTVLAAASSVRRAGGTFILNASPLDHLVSANRASLLAATDILLVNHGEAASLLDTPHVDPDEAAARLARDRRAAIVTLGAAGLVWSAGDEIGRCAGYTVTAIDTTGCGDAFAGAFAAAIERGEPIAQAASFGNAAGALAATRHGAQNAMPTRAAISQFLATHA